MSDLSDVAAAVSVIDTRYEAWNFIERFSASWVAPLRERDGYRPDEIHAAEERLGVEIPLALRQAYEIFGRRTDLISNQDILLDPSELYVDADEKILVYRIENQGAGEWGVSLDDPIGSDPPVKYRASTASPALFEWQEWSRRLSLSCVYDVIHEALFNGKVSCRAHIELSPDYVRSVESEYSHLSLANYPDRWQIRWFSAPDTLLRLRGDANGLEDPSDPWNPRGSLPELRVRTRIPEALEEVRAAFITE